MESHFVTLFDISQKHPDWKMLMGPAFIVVGSLVVALREFLHKRRFNYFVGTGVFAMVGFIVGYGYYKDITYGLAGAESTLRDGRFLVVEGRIRDFVPMPFGGHSDEQFTVDGIHFSYSDFLIQPCFNHTSSHGGPIREGIWVRLSYEGNCILRIEEWQSTDLKPEH